MSVAFLAVSLLLQITTGSDNPLVPDGPASAKITYRKLGEVERTVWASAGRVRSEERGPSYSRVIVVTETDIWVEEKSGESGVLRVRSVHCGTLLRGDVAALDEEMRRAFQEKREELWNLYSPAFEIDAFSSGSVGEWKGTEEETLWGRECVVVRRGETESAWRWKGTDLFLKIERGGKTILEAEKVEEKVALPADLFRIPGWVRDVAGEVRPAQERARKIFHWMTGREAKAEISPESSGPLPLRLSGEVVAFEGYTFQFAPWREKGFHLLSIESEKDRWRFQLLYRTESESLKSLDGASIRLGPPWQNISINKPPFLLYNTEDVMATIRVVDEETVVVRVAKGKWTKSTPHGEAAGGQKQEPVEIDGFEIRATKE